ncbi:MAG: phosphoribulokinase [Aphanocapsa feldmannii 277cV]|uniref:Phosphoribulokinase n=2 Tax=Aphanocapsa feldmannii TaxID=192050 RepID=A0A524RQE3_9CHRO|nr:MAG: phosphoribulokinase [Aphanocapsa feldmannii 288cV]TGG93700.1 MAG: phosphoribulokinase [Aphanocapsa feldmannii 277cV]TGH20063.1 MAG: phosphoribulokinase [Aphanocapsa feldmannii 277cI]
MSKRHPIVAVTGSSGAGTSTVKRAFERIFRREGITPAVIEGDSYHRFDRVAMKAKMAEAVAAGQNFSHFGPEANIFDKLQTTFAEYGESGAGERRYYLHSPEESAEHNTRLGTNLDPGEFTPWEPLPANTDLLFYEGLHGGVKGQGYNVASLVDLLIGVVPITNLEWIQKIHRDNSERGYSAETIVDTILRRMPDYINHVCPQFSQTHINFQRVPTVDTSNPFICRDIPTPDESFVIIHFRRGVREMFNVDFTYLLKMIDGSFMSSPTSLVVGGGKMGFAMELILTPIIHRMIEEKQN